MLAIDSALYIPELEIILAEFAQRFPATAVELMSVASPDVLSMVNNDQAHLGLMFANNAIPDFVDICYVGNIPFF